MNIIKNEGFWDRSLRLILAEVLFLLGFFWCGGTQQILLFVFAGALALTSLFGYCGLYTVLGIHTCSSKQPVSKTVLGIFIFIVLSIAIGGSYASIFFSKKFFLEDYTAMNQFYKQALFYTGQEKRDEARSNYSELVSAYAVFQKKYQSYHPYTLSHDTNLDADLEKISTMIASPKEKIESGDLKSAHYDLEQIRPVFQDILKRNGFSMLAVYLVDFHDAMEKIIEYADTKNGEGILAVYPEVDEKLRAVENVASDAEIVSIRAALEAVVTSAKNGDLDALSERAATLKSAFVKVYLKRG